MVAVRDRVLADQVRLVLAVRVVACACVAFVACVPHGRDVRVLANVQHSGGGVAAVAGAVYFADADGIKRVPTGGGVPTIVVSATGVTAWVTDGVDVFWASTDGTLSHALVANGTAEVIGSVTSVDDLAIDATTIYVAGASGGYDPRSGCTSFPSLFAVPRGGGTLVALASSGSCSGGVLPRVAVDADSVYWLSGAALLQVPKSAPATARTLARHDVSAYGGFASALAVDDASVYVVGAASDFVPGASTDPSVHCLFAIDKQSGVARQILCPPRDPHGNTYAGQIDINCLAVDDDRVYFGPDFWAVPKKDSTASPYRLAPFLLDDYSFESAACSIALDASGVYELASGPSVGTVLGATSK